MLLRECEKHLGEDCHRFAGVGWRIGLERSVFSLIGIPARANAHRGGCALLALHTPMTK